MPEVDLDAFLSDIRHIRYCFSQEMYTVLMVLFIHKWEAKAARNAEINSFLVYFRKEWLDKRIFWWYRAAAPNQPVHNNALEIGNRWFKEMVGYNRKQIMDALDKGIYYLETHSRRRNRDNNEDPIVFKDIPTYSTKVP